MTAPTVADALAPVRDALLAAARADADRVVAAADADAAAALAAAHEQAARILTQAREQGTADAIALVAAERARARRRARAMVLRARREAYEELRAQARAAVARPGTGPASAQLRERLVAAAHRVLGPQARVRESGDGGIVAHVSGRRLDLSLSGFADRAFDALYSDAGPPFGVEPRWEAEPTCQADPTWQAEPTREPA